MINRFIISLTLFALWSGTLLGQGHVHMTYYDEEETHIKEKYTLKSVQSNILNGSYEAFFEDGNPKTVGQYFDNKPNGTWEFYYENGELRIRGNIENGVNNGYWEYFYSNGQLNMDGEIVNGKRDGYWKMYFQNGALKSEGSYSNGNKEGKWKYYFQSGGLRALSILEAGNGQYEEYFAAGGIKMKGMKTGDKKSGFWTYYYEGGTKKGEGVFRDDLKQGKWSYYNEEGIRISEGNYSNDQPSGLWIDYHTNGTVSSRGNYNEGQKEGNWNLFYNDGSPRGEGVFSNGSGEYREYYKSGAIKIKGQLKNGKNNGTWEYFYENGEKEGTCEFEDGIGDYIGYYSDGTKKMKGTIRNNERVGIWELYKENGEIAGYYKPYYENGNPELWLAKDSEQQQNLNKKQARKSGTYKYKKKKFQYFKPALNEYKAIIIGYNPVAPLFNSFPLGIEYYQEERLGHEILFNLIREPFFRNHSSIEVGKEYKMGGEIALRQKFYRPSKKTGSPYFGHEVRYSSVFHSVKTPDQIIPENIVELTKNEQKYEYSIFLGNRYFKVQKESGFTIDTYIGIGIGYRTYTQDYTDTEDNKEFFSDLPSSNISIPIRLGVNLGFAIPVR